MQIVLNDIFTEWFQVQREFATPFEEMSPPELNKCLEKFYLSARKRDGSFCIKKITYRDPNRVGSSLVVSVLSARENIGIVAGMCESKSIFGGVYYLTVLIYTKTTIQLLL